MIPGDAIIKRRSDPDGHKKYQKAARPGFTGKTAFVSRFNAPLHRLLDDMAETMLDVEGAGLAAPQVGISKKLLLSEMGMGLLK